jgi:hypothetical protein
MAVKPRGRSWRVHAGVRVTILCEIDYGFRNYAPQSG